MAAKDLLLKLLIQAQDGASAIIRKVKVESSDLAGSLDSAGEAADKASKQLDDVGKAADVAHRELSSVGDSTGDLGDRQQQLANDVQKTGQQLNSLGQALSRQTVQQQAAAAQAAQYSSELKNTADVQRRIKVTSPESVFSGLAARAANASRDVQALGKELQGLGVDTSAANKEAAALNARLSDLDSTRRLIDNLRQMRTGLNETAQTLAIAEVRTQQLGRQLATTEQPSAELRREFDRQRSSLIALRGSHQQQTIQLQQTRAQLNAAGVSTRELSSQQKQLAMEAQRVGQRLDDLTDSLRKQVREEQAAAGVAEQYRQRMLQVDKAHARLNDNQPGATFRSVAEEANGADLSVRGLAASMLRLHPAVAAVAAVTAGLAAAGIDGVRSAADLEERLDRVAAVTGATRQQMQALKVAADAAGQSTKFTAAEAASGLEILARAGFNAQQAINALPGLLNLATIEGIGLDQAATILNDTLSIFQRSSEQAGETVDLLARTSSMANTNISELGLALSYAGSYAETANLSLEQMNAVIAVLAQNGLRGERAGTALRGILAQLSDPTSTATAELRRLGITSSNLIDVIEVLRQKGGTATRAIVAFGTEAGPGLRALIKSGAEGVAAFEQQLTHSQGAADAMAKTITQGLNQSVISFGSAWDGIKRQFGDQWLPTLTAQVKLLTTWVRELGSSKDLQAWGTATAWTFSKLASITRALYNGFTALFKTLELGAATIAYTVVRVVEGLLNVLEFFAPTLTDLRQSVTELRRSLGDIATDLSGQIAQDVRDGGEAIRDTLTGVSAQTEVTAQALATLGIETKEATDAAAEATQAASDKIVSALKTVVDKSDLAGEQLAQAFTVAVNQVNATEQLASVESALARVGEQGRLSTQQITALQNAVDMQRQLIAQAADTATQTLVNNTNGVQQLGNQVAASTGLLLQNVTALKAALDALGVDSEAVMGGVTSDFTLLLNNLDVVTQSAQATGKVITSAFMGAIAKAKNQEELEAINAKLIQTQALSSATGIEFDKLFAVINEKTDPAAQALEKLGVPVNKLRNEMSAAERDTLKLLHTIVTSAESSTRELAMAFDKAINSAETVAGIGAVKSELEAAFKAGKLSATDYQKAVKDATDKTTELTNELKLLKSGNDPLKALTDQTRDVASAANAAADAYDRMGEAADKASRQGNRKVNATNQTAKAIQSKGDEQAQQQLAELNALYSRQVNNARIPGEITNATNSYNEQAKRILAQSEARARQQQKADKAEQSATVNRSEHVIRLIDPNGQEATLFASSEQDATRTVNLLKDAARRSGRGVA